MEFPIQILGQLPNGTNFEVRLATPTFVRLIGFKAVKWCEFHLSDAKLSHMQTFWPSASWFYTYIAMA